MRSIARLNNRGLPCSIKFEQNSGHVHCDVLCSSDETEVDFSLSMPATYDCGLKFTEDHALRIQQHHEWDDSLAFLQVLPNG